MAARRALEWIRTSKASLVFRYETLDLFFFAGGYISFGVCMSDIILELLLLQEGLQSKNSLKTLNNSCIE